MKETENRQYCKQNICDPSIANCRLLIAQQLLEFRNVIGSVFCVNRKSVQDIENCVQCGKCVVWNGSAELVWQLVHKFQIVHIVSDVPMNVFKQL